MLPYPNHHRFWISQEPGQQPNPTGYVVAPAHLEQIQHYDHFFFPGHGQFNSETLEAVLRPRPAAAPQAAAGMAMAMAAAQEPRNGVAAVGGSGHARARKRPFRTDRHSKIRTAQGVRDRRMRLSLDVARDFFALQDQLGFDKASKTVDWLLTQSKPAIERLSESSRLNAGGEEGMTTSSLTPAERSVRRLKDVMAEAAGSGKGGVDVEKVRARGGGSALTEHGCELNGLMPAAMTGEYYYDLDEMVSNGGEGDDGEYEEDGDFLDGMQY